MPLGFCEFGKRMKLHVVRVPNTLDKGRDMNGNFTVSYILPVLFSALLFINTHASRYHHIFTGLQRF